MKKTLAIIMAVLMIATALFAFASCTKPADNAAEKTDLEYIKANGKIVIGVTDYAPFDYEEGGEWVGFDADMARLLGEEIGVDVEFVEIDWEEKIIELQSKKIDAIWNGMTVTDELAEAMDFSNPYAENCQVIVYKNPEFNTVEALEGKKIAVESGSAGETAAIEEFGEENVTGLPGQTKALFEVQAGTSDAAVVDYSMAKSLCGSGDYADLKFIEEVRIGEEQFAVGVRQGSELVGIINTLFADTLENGKMAELQEKYGAQEDGSNSIALIEAKG